MAAELSNGVTANGIITNGVQENHAFQAAPPTKHIERMRRAKEEHGDVSIAFSDLWLGIAAEKHDDGQADMAFSCHDGTYTIDFCHYTLPKGHNIEEFVINKVDRYRQQNRYKFLGAGLSQEVARLSPEGPARLWTDLDIVPTVFPDRHGENEHQPSDAEAELELDEVADIMAKKCLGFFGPNGQPRVQVNFSQQVAVDLSGRAQLTTLNMYEQTSRSETWRTIMKYAASLRKQKVKIAFFSATPQGGGVALMRHALIRFLRHLGVDATWWVPRPKTEVFRITKTNHNILQGVAAPEERLTPEKAAKIERWIENNARPWKKNGGPLSPRNQGGADVIVVDDPQMPKLIDISKDLDPHRPVIFRSHIQVRADLAQDSSTPTAEVWQWLWQSVRKADVFISHPVSAFVPNTVPKSKLAYMPATTDWLDGLNKELGAYDTEYYLHQFRTECQRQRMTTLAFPKRDYIVQVARFDPSKGIPDVLASYAEFRRTSKFCRGKPAEETPQLVVCGHYSVDDPDGVMVLDQTLELLDTKYSDVKGSVVVMRLGPTDQLLNVLLSNAKVALQLSTREGFEVKVSEALHKGVPVIASNAGGIPLQVQHEKSGFVVETGDYKAVSGFLDRFFSDKDEYVRISEYAAAHVSDEVSTVGNAVCWMYLADQLSSGQGMAPNGRFVWDMARKQAGEPVGPDENTLPRNLTT